MFEGLVQLSIEEVDDYVLYFLWKTFVGPLDKNTGRTIKSYLQL